MVLQGLLCGITNTFFTVFTTLENHTPVSASMRTVCGSTQKRNGCFVTRTSSREKQSGLPAIALPSGGFPLGAAVADRNSPKKYDSRSALWWRAWTGAAGQASAIAHPAARLAVSRRCGPLKLIQRSGKTTRWNSCHGRGRRLHRWVRSTHTRRCHRLHPQHPRWLCRRHSAGNDPHMLS
jgi:hypothetical protein